VEMIGKTEKALREKLTPLIAPIGEAQQNIKDGIKDSIGDAITSVLSAHATPALEKLLPLLFEPIVNSHVVSYKIFQLLYKELQKEVKEHKVETIDKLKYDIRWGPLWRMDLWRGECSLWEKIDELELKPLEDNLRKLGKLSIFTFSPWRVRSEIFRSIENLIKDAFYTVQTEEKLKEELEAKKPLDDFLVAYYPTLARQYYHDSKLVIRETMLNILKEIILVPLQKAAGEKVKPTLESLDSKLPDTVKEFISVTETFDELLEGVVMGVLSEQVDKNKSIGEQLEDGFKKNSGVE